MRQSHPLPAASRINRKTPSELVSCFRFFCRLSLPGLLGTVNKSSTFFARLIQAIVGKAAQRLAFSTHGGSFNRPVPALLLPNTVFYPQILLKSQSF
jgi:hypothetical protein